MGYGKRKGGVGGGEADGPRGIDQLTFLVQEAREAHGRRDSGSR